MGHSGVELETKLLRDFVRWYYYDGSVGGLASLVWNNQYMMKVEKEYLDLLEKRP